MSSEDENKPKRLSTHLWHAKRLKMENTPTIQVDENRSVSFRMPITPTEKIRRPAWRQIKSGCILQDTSYLSLLVVKKANAEEWKLDGVLS